ncbi:hypothetical protein ACA910_017753 [Epithemia clementina (nom. ined.)]
MHRRPALEGALILPPSLTTIRSTADTEIEADSGQHVNTSSHNNNEAEEAESFSLYDWTVAFRRSVQLASEKAGCGATENLNVTMTLTPGTLVEPPPYFMSCYGSVKSSRNERVQLQPAADYKTGQLLMEMPSSPIINQTFNTSSPSASSQLLVTTNNHTLKEMNVTSAKWLVRNTSGTVFMSRHLRTYLHNLLVKQGHERHRRSQEEDTTLDRSSFRNQVDFAISLSAQNVDLDSSSVGVEGDPLPVVNHKSARVCALAPNFFEDLRHAFGIQESNYWKSLVDESLPFVSFQSNSKGGNRVGGLFFFSRDGSYMIKTLKSDEIKALLGSISSKYGPYMKQHGRSSLLSRCCGLYQVQMYATKRVNGTETTFKSRKHTFVVLNSVFPARVSKYINERFDLKGSTLGRKCSLDEIQRKGSMAVLKDLNLANEVEKMRSSQHFSGRRLESRGNSNNKSFDNTFTTKDGLHIGPVAKSGLLAQLRKDVKLLVECNTIDYSLLVGVHPRRSPTLDFLHGVISQRCFYDEAKSLAPVVLSAKARRFKTRLMFGHSFGLKANKDASNLPKLQSASVLYDDTWEQCGVNCGQLSKVFGERLGNPCVYYFGLIDFLQPYNHKKEAEYRWKTLKYGRRGGFSCIPPRPYAERFLAFLDRHIT